MTRIAGVILAGGLSRRMGGGDKGLLDLGGKPVIAHVIARLAPQVAVMVINANGDPARFSAFGLPVTADGIEDFAGPLAGVLAGLDWAAENGFDSIVTAAADTPFLPRDLVAHLTMAAMSDGNGLALAATPGPGGRVDRHPTFGLWPADLREDLRRALKDGTRKVIDWTDRHGAAIAVFPVEGIDPFFNVNTPEDMAAARSMGEP